MVNHRIRRKNNRTRKNVYGYLIIVASIAVVILLLGLRIYLSAKIDKIDENSLCPVEAGASAYTAILFDRSDQYNEIQKAELSKYFDALEKGLIIGEKVSIFLIDQNSPENIKPIFSLCNPDDGSASNPLYENPRLLKKRWEEKFGSKLNSILGEITKKSSSDISPILEMIQAVSVEGFPSNSDHKRKRLVIVSDMLHNMPEYSQYRDSVDMETLMARKHYFQHVRTDLRGVDVTILYIRREGAENLQNRRHAEFWARYVEEMGGTLVRVTRIQG